MIKINRYWLVNLFMAIDVEIIEINPENDIYKYLNRDYSKLENLKILVEDFLRPQYLFYSQENRNKIKLAFIYSIKYLSESELESVIDELVGSIIDMPLSNITNKDLCINIWKIMFRDESYELNEEVIDLNDSLNWS